MLNLDGNVLVSGEIPTALALRCIFNILNLNNKKLGLIILIKKNSISDMHAAQRGRQAFFFM